MWEVDHKEGWALKNWCFWTVVLKTLESPLDCKEIQPVHPKGDQSWIFIGKTDGEAETPILWLSDLKSWVFGQDPDAGKDWKQEEKGTTEHKMVGWHHWLNGHEFEKVPGVGDGQGNLVFCSPVGRERVGNNCAIELNWMLIDVAEDVEKLEPLYTAGGNGAGTLEDTLAIPQKIKHRVLVQDGEVEGHGIHLLPQICQKYFYIWNGSHRISTESLQKIPYNQSCKEDSPLNWVGWREKGEEEVGQDLQSWEGAVKDDHFPHPGNLLHWPWDPPGQIGSFRGRRGECRGSLATLQSRETPQMVQAVLPHFWAQDTCLLVWAATGCWNLGFRGQTQGWDVVWLWGNSPKGLEYGQAEQRVCTWLMVLPQKQTYVSVEQNREPRNKSTHLRSINLSQSRQEYTVETRQSL